MAQAQAITAMGISRNQSVTQLWMDSNAALKYQVELSDPQTVVVHLTGVHLGAPVPKPQADDPTVAGLEVRTEPGGLALVVRTKAPGVTVLPFYEAATRRLTLELGGAPSMAVELKTPPAPAPQAAKPEPTPAKKPVVPAPAKPLAVEPKPAPTTVAAPAAPSAPAAKPTPPTTLAAKQPAPGPAKPPKPSGPAPTIKSVRLGTHSEYTRLVLEGDGVLDGTFKWKGDRALLSLKRGKLAKGASLAARDKRVKRLRPKASDPLAIRISLASPVIWHRMFRLNGGRKLVLDLMLSASAPKAPKQTASAQVATAKAASPATAAPKATQAAAPTTTATTRAASPTTTPTTLAVVSVPPTTLAIVRPAPTIAPTTTATLAAVTTTRPTMSISSPARRTPGKPYMASGVIPPVGPPEPLARVRGRSGDMVHGTIGPLQGTPPTTAQVMDRVVRAQQQGQGVVRGSMPPPEDRRPPQAVKLGPDAKQSRVAENIFKRSGAALERRKYKTALMGFSYLLDNYPGHSQAGEAYFRRADAFYHLHQRDMLEHFDQVMKFYQQAITNSPDSNQVPWALLMMGKASMLNEEPFRAMGYFKLVADDYPKSEYLPLALDNMARAHLRQSKPVEALSLFREVIKKYPDSRYRNDAEWGTVQALFALGRYKRAAGVLQEMLARKPDAYLDNPELLYYLGEAEFQQRNYAEARRYYLWALNIRPDMADADIMLTRVGDTYAFDKKPKAAREIYHQVMDAFPGQDGALVAQMRLAEEPQKPQPGQPGDTFGVRPTSRAKNAYLEIIDEYPERQVAQLAAVKLGVWYYKMGRFEQSLETLATLLREHSTTVYTNQVRYTQGLSVRGLLKGLRKRNKPLELMDAFLRHRSLITKPNSNEVLDILAWAYDRAGLTTRAAKLYRVLVSRDLGRPEYNLALARNLMAARDYNGVVGTLSGPTPAKLTGAGREKAASLKGRALVHLGKYAEAIKLLEPLAKKSKAAAEDYEAYGTALGRLGKHAQALAALDKALKLMTAGKASALARYLVTMQVGSTAKKAGRLKRAVTAFEQAAKLAAKGQDKAAALYELAQVLRKQGQHEQVAKTFKQLKEMGVSPWSQMAERHLADMALAPRLAAVGK